MMACLRDRSMQRVASFCLLLGLTAPVDAADLELVATLHGHKKDVSGLAFYPNAKTLASASWDGTVRLWDVPAAKPIKTLAEQLYAFRSLASAWDGSALAAEDTRTDVTLWTRGSKQPATLEGAGRGLAFSPFGKFLVTGRTVWDVSTRTRVGEINGFLNDARCVSLAPLRAAIATPGTPPHGNGLYLWSLNGQWRRTLEQPNVAGIVALAFSPDGKLIAVSTGAYATVELWDVAAGKAERMPGRPQEIVMQLAFSPNGRLLAGATDGGAVVLWDMKTRKQYQTLAPEKAEPHSLTFSPDGEFLAVGGGDTLVRVWRLPEEYRGALPYGAHFQPDCQRQTGARLRCLAVRPDGKELATGAEDNWIELWEVGKDTPRLTLKGHRQAVTALAYSPNGKTLVSTGLDGTTRLWEVTTGWERLGVRGHEGSVLCVSFAPDGQAFATGGSDGTARIWSWEGKELRLFEGHKGAVRSLAFTPDGRALLTGGSDGTVRQWDPTGAARPINRLQVGGGIMAMAEARGGQALYVADSEGWVTRLDLAKGTSRRLLKERVEFPHALAMSPDGKTLALGNRLDPALRLYDAATGAEVDVLDWHSGWVAEAVFAPSGDLVAIASRDGDLSLWRLRPTAK